jgi:glycosyltransferase involved in cell wall biosynthesis
VVLFHGSYLPLHGIDVILHAAARLNARQDVVFRLVGRGPGYDRITSLAGELGLRNLEFRDFVPLADLPAMIAGADICLGGHFGTSDKALRVIAGKTFQDIAMGRTTIVGDTQANHELLTHGEDAWFVPPSDPDALAAAVARLADEPDLRSRIGSAAARTFLENASLEILAPQLEDVVRQMIAPPHIHP